MCLVDMETLDEPLAYLEAKECISDNIPPSVISLSHLPEKSFVFNLLESWGSTTLLKGLTDSSAVS